MAETKDELQRRVDELQADNEKLRGQLATATGRTVPAPAPFALTEGDRQELEARGYATVGGRVITTEEARKLAPGVEIRDVDGALAEERDRVVGALRTAPGGNVRGVDYVWPSVERGGIDPTVAGVPGISGPAAGTNEAAAAEITPA
jgi:hypothetical protein